MFLIQESQNPADWREPPDAETKRRQLVPSEPHTTKRGLYPFRFRLKKSCISTRLDAGHIFQYARVKASPAIYPIEVWTVVNGQIRQISYSSAEGDVILAED